MLVRRLPTIIGLVLATGCSQIFDLDKPDLADPIDAAGDMAGPTDRDGDGILDGTDNCPDVPNPDQVDVDQNQIGDICEGCTMLPLRMGDDDDSDTLADTADNCFGVTQAQQDADNDGIGNACDVRTGKDTRFCIWTFRPPGLVDDPQFWSTAWTLPTLNWSIIDNQLRHEPSAALEVASPASVWFEGPAGISFDTKLTLGSYQVPVTWGVELLLDSVNGQMTFTCQLVQTANNSAVVQLLYNGTVHDSVPINVAVPQGISSFVQLSATTESSNKLVVRCAFDATFIPKLALQHEYPTTIVRARPRVFADRATLRFDHLAMYKLGVQ
jgi:hypothetical protein